MNTNDKINRILENKNPDHLYFKYNKNDNDKENENDKENKDNKRTTSKFTIDDSDSFKLPQSKKKLEKEIIFNNLLDNIKIDDMSFSIK